MNENLEMINMWDIDRKKCLRCGACVGVCPEIAIELRNNGITYNEELCALCGLCEKVCSVGAIEVTKNA